MEFSVGIALCYFSSIYNEHILYFSGKDDDLRTTASMIVMEELAAGDKVRTKMSATCK
jgi:hypothetical protein